MEISFALTNFQGLYFNPLSDSCDYPTNVACQAASGSSQTSTTTFRPYLQQPTTLTSRRKSAKKTTTTTTTTTTPFEEDEEEEEEEEVHADRVVESTPTDATQSDKQELHELMQLISNMGENRIKEK